MPTEIPLAVLQCRGLTMSQKVGAHIEELATGEQTHIFTQARVNTNTCMDDTKVHLI